MKEVEIREHVRKLKRFYTDLTIYVFVNLTLILVWVISGGGYFWPIFVIIGWGIGLVLQAFNLGFIPLAVDILPFLNKNWEELQVSKIMKDLAIKNKDKDINKN